MSFFKKIFFAFTKKERVSFLVFSGIAVASFVVVMSMTIANATTTIPTQGGEFTEGVVGQPEYVNPVTAESETDLSLVKLVYANLDDVADSITTSPDGRTWTVHLKEGLTWQDGQKLTSDDVIFTVQSIQNPDADSPLAASWQGVSVNRVSELELQFTLANPYAFFADNLKALYILPKHIFADVPPGNWRLSNYNLKPVGSGPYQFVSYDEQSNGFVASYHLAAWSGYAGTAPLIQNFNINFFGNQNDLTTAFNVGQVDGFGNITSGDISNIERPYNLSAWRTPQYYAIFFNQSKNLALQDANVREALVESVDREALVSGPLGGKGVAEYGPIPPDMPYFVDLSPAATLSPSSTPSTSTPAELASALLSQAGWQVSTSSNFRSKTIGNSIVPLVVNLTVPDIDYLVTTADILQSEWQAIGVQVTIATDTPADIVANDVKNRGYESLLFGNVLGPSSDLYAFWDSSERFSPGLNLAIYSNPAVDNLIETARVNLSEASRTAEFAAAQEDIVNDNPAVFLYSPDYLFVTDKNIQGATPGVLPDPSDLSREMTSWYLNTARVLK